MWLTSRANLAFHNEHRAIPNNRVDANILDGRAGQDFAQSSLDANLQQT